MTEKELRKEFTDKFCFTTALGNVVLNCTEEEKLFTWFYAKIEEAKGACACLRSPFSIKEGGVVRCSNCGKQYRGTFKATDLITSRAKIEENNAAGATGTTTGTSANICTTCARKPRVFSELEKLDNKCKRCSGVIFKI